MQLPEARHNVDVIHEFRPHARLSANQMGRVLRPVLLKGDCRQSHGQYKL